MKQLVDFPNYYITMEGIVINKMYHDYLWKYYEGVETK